MVQGQGNSIPQPLASHTVFGSFAKERDIGTPDDGGPQKGTPTCGKAPSGRTINLNPGQKSEL